MSGPTVFVEGMRGLGDNIFQRAFVKPLTAARTVFLATPWPELYEDLAVRFVHMSTPLRTQAKNIARQPRARWQAAPSQPFRKIVVRYGHNELRDSSIVKSMERCFGVPPAAMDLPPLPSYASDRPIAVVRPATARTEWLNLARNPNPEYIAAIAADLMRDYMVVSVADLVVKQEWLVGPAPPAHLQLHSGELAVRELLGLICTADVIVGGPGWIVPAAIAAKTPLFCILGGHGGHNGPSKITDPRMDLSHVGFATPDNFCQCESMRHQCNKSNTRIMDQWREWREQRGI